MDYHNGTFASSESENDISSDDQDLDDSPNSFSHKFHSDFVDNDNKPSFGRAYDTDMMDSTDNTKQFTKKSTRSNHHASTDQTNRTVMPFNPKAYGKGFNILAKMGYKGGGLGKDGSGRIEPIIVTSSKGKQVDIIDNNTSSADNSGIIGKNLTVKFIGQDETSASTTERWSSDSNYVTADMSDSIAKCENFINNISRGKVVKLESSRTKGAIGTLVNTLIAQAQHDLVRAMNNRRDEQQKIDSKSDLSIDLRDKLNRKNSKLDDLKSLLTNFNTSAALHVEDDGQEIMASYLSSSMAKIKAHDIICSPHVVDNLRNQFIKMLYHTDTKDMISFDIKKRLYESHVVKALVQFFKEWDVEQVEQGLDIYTKWNDFKSLSTLPIQVITARIIDWLNSSNSADILPPHLIIHPWLPYLNDTELLYTCLIKLFYRLVNIRQDLAVPLIDKWHFLKSDSVGDSFKELIGYIRGKFKSQIATININFDMKNFLSLVDCLFKSQMYTIDVMATDLSSLVSKYAKVVEMWIRDGEIERVAESYQFWSDALSPILDHSLIKPHFFSILNAMNDSTDDLIPNDVGYVEESKSVNQTNLFVQHNVQQITVSSSISRGKIVNLFDYLSNVAMKKGIDLRPKLGRIHDGKQVYTFGRVLIIVERLLIYAMVDKVWKPVNIPQLLKLAS
ncbi:hypothetical protein BMR1_03g01025 [Babesia microti strain RI]|uniref:G-patch domain-containing protein n=1 Tax=Babesia microti (strain RI) TaxID=1133968 RepID=A0A0K3AM29_BABMR|nr:hypothetical protein BMR1_03g01025 [Babesia microti strain RI]CTQ40804.1 hypothetical protein BMR1_03g01025 [Babesia microti strain RI]|eukprot:XP_012648815.1 hypothetical protein BMR1_03g01025 [Babesia microti strain RI]